MHREEHRLCLHASCRDLFREESGQDMVEYALVAALIGLGCIAGVKTLSSQINNVFNSLPQLFYNAIYS